MFRKLIWGSGAVFALALTLVLGTEIVFAHSRPIRFDPPPGTVLSAAPAQVTGWFTSEIRRDPNWAFIQVKDGQGNRVDSGDIILSTDRRQMSIALKSGLTAGAYTVTWRTWDDNDGEIFGDCYTFFVGQAAADAAITNKTRLDGGGASTCQRAEISGKDATPAPNATLTSAAQAGAQEEDAPMDTTSSGGSSGDVPVWALVAGVVVGVVVGGVGGRFLGSHS